MSLDDFDAALTYTSFEPHLAKAKTPKQKEHLDTVIHHSKGEVLANLDMVLPTLSDDPQYHEYGVFASATEDTGPKGLAEVKANYTDMVESGSYIIESKKTRVVDRHRGDLPPDPARCRRQEARLRPGRQRRHPLPGSRPDDRVLGVQRRRQGDR
jgi:hypothetical protein